MTTQRKHLAFRRHTLALRAIILVVVLSVPIALYTAAQAGNQPLLWVLIGIMISAMGLAAWIG
jgi:hypothetical protein